MKLLAQQNVSCPTAVQRHESARPIRHARVCSIRRPLQQHKYIKLGSSQSVSLSKHPALTPTIRHTQHCCMAQANEDGLELPNSQRPQLESLKLQQSVRNSVQDAVESLGGRVTVGDVSARAGVKISEAEEALNALAADASGTLEVSDSGDVLYVLPSNFKQIVAGKSWLLRAEPFFQKIRDASAYLVRVTFGTALITSVVLVWVTIVAILSSSGKDDDRRRGNNNGYAYANAGPRIWFSPTDVFWYLDPYYMRRRRMRQETGQGMNFLEAIFSFVFGDGNPNESYEDRRWRLIGNYIQHKGGVVTAEELAPYLDVPAAGKDPESIVVDESYVVPALVRFGGSPEVDNDNNLIYRFPSLQKTGRQQVAPTPSERFALEEEWKLTEATGGQKTGAIALGLANLVGVVVLGGLLADPQTRYSLAQSSLSFVLSSFPALQVYAAAFFAIPLIRWIINQGRNRNIQQRNEARKDIATVLQRPDGKLRAKLQSAAKQAQRTVISDKDIVYSSNKDLSDQNLDLDGESFDKRLAELERQSDFDSKVDRGGQSSSKKKALEW
ncbi:TPA: hypothetical protein ACH3X1_001454 [Trebouxia sp. C0004]